MTKLAKDVQQLDHNLIIESTTIIEDNIFATFYELIGWDKETGEPLTINSDGKIITISQLKNELSEYFEDTTDEPFDDDNISITVLSMFSIAVAYEQDNNNPRNNNNSIDDILD